MTDAYQTELPGLVDKVVRHYRERLDELLTALPIGATLCVHDDPARNQWQPDRDMTTIAIRSKAHVLAADATCDDPARREQYGPMTAEIQEQIAEMADVDR